MEKYCPKCDSIIEEPSSNEMHNYVYWRDNICYKCHSTMIVKKVIEQNSTTTIPIKKIKRGKNKKRIKWGWIVFLVLLILIIYLMSSQPWLLKVEVRTLKNDDSSVFWITNEESIPIKLLEIEINGDYILKNFPDNNDTYMNEQLIGRGKSYIQPKEKIIIFTKYFYDSDGKKFDYYNTVFTKISVTAEVGDDWRISTVSID